MVGPGAAIFKIAYSTHEGPLLLRCFGRDENGKRVDLKISGTEPYFFVLEAEKDRAAGLSEVVRVEPGPKSVDGRQLVKVITRFPYDVGNIRERFSYHCEADISFSLRTRGDYQLNHVELPPPNGETIPVSKIRPLAVVPKVKPRTLHIDIEVEDRYGFSKPENPTAPVLSVAFKDTYRDRLGIIYNGPPVDPEAVRRVMNEHLPSHAQVTCPIVVFPKKNEAEVLAALGDLLSKVEPDFLSAYNGSNYDFPYLGGRAIRVQETLSTLNAEIRLVAETFDDKLSRNSGRFALADPLELYRKKKLRALQYNLDSVATEVLGYGKIPRDTTVGELRRTDPVRFAAYNLIDVVDLYRVEEKEDLIAYGVRIAMETNTEVADVYSASRGVDGSLFRILRETGKVELALPSKDFAPKMMRAGKGSEVFDVRVGIHLAVVAIDFSEEYPSLMMTFNIDPTTRVGRDFLDACYDLPTGGRYQKATKGMIYRALARIRKVRKEAKAEAKKHAFGTPERINADTISAAVKAVVNAFAGVVGSKDWRLGNVEVFEDITGMARLQLNLKKSLLEAKAWVSKVLGFPSFGIVIQGDTDSTFVKFYEGDPAVQITDLDRLMTEIVPKIHAALTKEYDAWAASFGAEENLTRDAIDGAYEILRTLPLANGDGSTGAKKRYYGLMAFDGETDVRSLSYERRLVYKGIEVKRRNNAEITRTVQKHLMDLTLHLRPTAEAVEYLETTRKEVFAGKRDEELPIPCQLSKDRGLYPHATDFVKAMDNFRGLTGRGIIPGDEFKWFYVRGGVRYAKNDGIGSDYESIAIPYSWTVAEAREKGFEFEIDYEAMFYKSVQQPARLVYPEIEGTTPSMDDEW